jgi:hypothetical protein
LEEQMTEDYDSDLWRKTGWTYHEDRAIRFAE